MDERTEILRRMVADLDMDPNILEAGVREMNAMAIEAARACAEFEDRANAALPGILGDVTRDFLTPALAAYGVTDPDRYRLAYEWQTHPEHAFRPGVFEQEGDGRCPCQQPCAPWPKADSDDA